MTDWFRAQLLDDILPHWLEAAVSPNGYLHPYLDREWRRIEPSHATLVSQCRLLYCFSAGWRHTGDAHYREAVASGVAFLLEHFADREHPGWLFSVDETGAPIDMKKDAYGHAFLVFGLAHAAKTLGDRSLHDMSLAALELLRTAFRDREPGSLIQTLTRELRIAEEERSQNPIMHLFEAHLALLELFGPDETVASSAQEFGEFVHRKLGNPQTGRLPELFDEQWRELPREQGGFIVLGHALEWAFLLSRGVQLGLETEWLPVAETILRHGLEVGEAPDGGLYTFEAPEGGLVSESMGWWEQAELLRALMHFARTRGREDLWPKLERHLAFVQESFVDPEFGGWYSTSALGGKPPEDAGKGNAWKVDYHIVAMCEEALLEGSREGS